MLTLRDIIRSGHVVRWSSVKHGRPQYLAEHHYMVTMIARALARRVLTDEYYSLERQLLLVEYCLNHDLPELLAGDLPSVTKRKLGMMLEEKSNVFKELDYEIHPPLRKLDEKLKGTALEVIAKLADWADAIVYIQQEGAGNFEAKIVSQYLSALLNHSLMGDVPGAKKQAFLKELEEAPVSHTHGIELKLKKAYRHKVSRAKTTFPSFNWEAANEILSELLEGEDANIRFEYE